MTGRLRIGSVGLSLAIALVVSAAHADIKDARKSYLRGDYASALTEYKRLAEAGNVDAQARLGEIYYTGRGALEDLALAHKWLKAAAQQGDVGSQVNLGLILAQNSEFEAAAKWFGMAAAKGDTAAMNNMAAFHMRGLGVDQNIRLAFAMLEKVAERGDSNDQYQLGMMYLQGMSGAPDMVNGLKWLTRAAGQGNAEAQLRLGAVLSENEGPDDRLVKAYKWIHLASMFGADNANQMLADLSEKMTAGQIAEAKRLALSWQPGNN